MPTVDLNDYTVFYQHAGEGHPLILLHGFPTSSHLFHQLIPPLAEHFAVYALDLLGYGESHAPPDNPIHLEAQAAMVGAFADALALKPFTLVGHDLGGGIGQVIGVHRADWLRRMVWINTVALDNFPIGRISALIWGLKIPGVAALLKHSPILRRWARAKRGGLKDGVYDKTVMDEVALQHFIFEPFLQNTAGVARFIRAVKAQRKNGQITRRLTNDLSRINTATLLLWGEDDAFFSLDWPRRLQERVPGIREFYTIPQAGHFCPLDKPAAITEHIIRFCTSSTT